MSDFLGSYYDSADVDGLDDKVFSQRMAMLALEQPVSVLDMDNLDSVKLPSRIRAIDALGNQDQYKFEKRQSSDDDFSVPVASMSAFDQEKPSLVSIQLQSLRAIQLYDASAGKHAPPKHMDLALPVPSLVSTRANTTTGEGSSSGQTRMAVTCNDNVSEADSKSEKRSPRASFFKFFGRISEPKNRRK